MSTMAHDDADDMKLVRNKITNKKWVFIVGVIFQLLKATFAIGLEKGRPEGWNYNKI